MQDQPQPQSFLSWSLEVMGPVYAGVVPLIGLLICAGGAYVAIRFRRPEPIAACLAFVPLPLLIGAFGMLEGIMELCGHLSTSPPSPPRVFGKAVALILLAPMTAAFTSIAALLVVAGGFALRTLSAKDQSHAAPGPNTVP